MYHELMMSMESPRVTIACQNRSCGDDCYEDTGQFAVDGELQALKGPNDDLQ